MRVFFYKYFFKCSPYLSDVKTSSFVSAWTQWFTVHEIKTNLQKLYISYAFQFYYFYRFIEIGGAFYKIEGYSPSTLLTLSLHIHTHTLLAISRNPSVAFKQLSFTIKELTLRKMRNFHLISWRGNFVETHIFCRVLWDSPETLLFHKISTPGN